MKHVGNILQSARQELQLSVEDIALRTRIQRDMIYAIEQGDADALPAEVYLRGFVRAIANELKLDAESVVAQLGAPGTEPYQAESADDGLHNTRYARLLGQEADLDVPLVNAGHLVLAVVALTMLLGAWLLVGTGNQDLRSQDPRSASDKPVIQERVDAVSVFTADDVKVAPRE